MFRFVRNPLIQPILRKATTLALGLITLINIGHSIALADPYIYGQPAQADQANQNKPPAQSGQLPVAVAEEPINPRQPLHTGFLINVSVAHEPEPSGIYTVNQAGDILLHIADTLTPVAVSGQTPEQAAETIAGFLKTYLRKPRVIVSIVAVPHANVNVGGAVRSPGPFVITGLTTLADVLSRAEWTENANLSQVRLTRRDMVQGEEKIHVMTLHLDTYVRPIAGATPDELQNPILQDRDVIFVPYKALVADGTVTVAGAVLKPQTGLPLRTNPPLTLREAISLSGGLSLDADRRKVTLRRAGSDEPLLINLDRAEKNDPTANVSLRADDSIYVEKLAATEYYTVNGGVTKPGKFPFDHPVTLTQAIMDAGGLAIYAHDKKGYILRTPDGLAAHTRVVTFNWQQILTRKDADIPLQPGDNVWIAPGGAGRSTDIFTILSALGSLRLLL